MDEKRIFISYGHDKYSSVVERFAEDCSSIFADVFIDGKSLNVGERYDNKIEEAIEHYDVVVFFMTKYSVRVNNSGLTNADDSFCRDEIEYARSCRKSIIPVMLEDCRPPLIVHRLQYINGKKILCDSTIDEEEYVKTKNNIFATICDVNALAQCGESYSLMQVLNQFDNDAYSKGMTRDFTGRKWLSRKCLSWVNESKERVLCILGEIGSGKSSFITNLAINDEDGFFAGIHYCRFDIEASIKVRNIIKSLTYSVATQITGFSQFIEGISERVLDTASGIELFEKLLVEPLNKIESQNIRKAVVIIDAIDEITDPQEREELLEIISDNSRLLPDWFKIIITSRPDSKLEYLLQDTTMIKIDTSSEENIKDIRDYVDNFLMKHNLTISYENRKEIIKGSGGNFLYIYFALSDLLEGGSSYAYGKKYPRGLDGIYARTINRKFKNINEYEKEIVPIFEVLCATKAPISIDDLSRMIGEGKRSLLLRIQKVAAFIRKDNNTLCFYHKSLAEWLVNWDKSGEFYIELEQGEKKIVSWIKNPENEFITSNYCMSYGVNHLIENKEYRFLNQLLQDKQFVVAEKYSSVLLEYVYHGQLDIVERVVKNICIEPSVVSFVVIRRIVDGAINAGQFDSAIRVNEYQKEIDAYEVFYYCGLGNIILYSRRDLAAVKSAYMEGMMLAEERYAQNPSDWNTFALSSCNSRLGKIMVESMRMDDAMMYYQQLLNLSRDLYRKTKFVEVLRNIAIAYERIGWIQQSKSNYNDALTQYNRCLIESKKIFDETKTTEAMRGVAITYERLGRVAEIQGDFEKAVEYYMNNYSMSNEIYGQMSSLNSKRGLANSCHCLGDAFIGQRKYKEALAWFQKDKQISSEIYSVTNMIDDTRDYAICLDRLAFTNDKLGKSDEAEVLFVEAVRLYFQIIDRTKSERLVNEYVIECIRLAEFYLLHDMIIEAVKIIERVKTIVNQEKIPDEIVKYMTILQGVINGDSVIREYDSLCNRRNTK